MKWRFAWRALIAAAALACMQAAVAQGAGGVRKQTEASLRIEGEITVDAEGRIADYTIRDPDTLPPDALNFARQEIAGWTFEPPRLDGKPVNLRNEMSILLVASRVDDSNFRMRVQATRFQPMTREEGRELTSRRMDPPRYPLAAAQAEVQGTVYLLLKVGRDGRVQDLVVEQVNLRVVASENVMSRLRDQFASSARAAARKWLFDPPTQGEEAQAESWTLRIPVDYSMVGSETKYGRWVAYIPGPREKPDWIDQALVDGSPEALVAGKPQLLGGKGGLHLRAPPPQEG